jgi:putative membrane protein
MSMLLPWEREQMDKDETEHPGQRSPERTVDAQTGPKGGDSRARDHLANERTLLAWARTGIAMMGLGFVVARFGLLIRELGARVRNPLPTGISAAFGTTLVVLGAVMLALATARYLRVGREIDAQHYRWSPALNLALSGLLVLAGVVLAVYLIITE